MRWRIAIIIPIEVVRGSMFAILQLGLPGWFWKRGMLA